MNKPKEKYQELVVRFLAGECSAKEEEMLHEWLNQSSENRVILEQYRKIWQLQPTEATTTFDTIDAWEKVERRISPGAPFTSHSRSLLKRRYLIYTIAAAMTLLFGLYFIFQYQSAPNQLHYIAHNTPETMILPDNSQVFLNAGSQLTLNESFSGKTRHVSLDGEAFFVVTPNAQKPFIVNIGETMIKVLGTSFNVAERHDRNLIDVAVMTGSVVFSSTKNSDHKILLSAGEMGIFDRAEGKMHKATLDNKNFMAWRTGVLEFEQTPLTMVLSTLEKNYKISIQTQQNISELKLTGRFNNETPEDIFKTLQLVFGFEVEQHGKTFILK